MKTSALFNRLTRNSRLGKKITKAKIGVEVVEDCEGSRDRMNIRMWTKNKSLLHVK